MSKGESVSISFVCIICGNTQKVEQYTFQLVPPICDECKKDLKEIILLKRANNLKSTALNKVL